MKHGIYVFRNDTGHGKDFWAWDIHGDCGDHIPVTKWGKLPKAQGRKHYHVTLFDIEAPPRTVSYLPLLDDKY